MNYYYGILIIFSQTRQFSSAFYLTHHHPKPTEQTTITNH